MDWEEFKGPTVDSLTNLHAAALPGGKFWAVPLERNRMAIRYVRLRLEQAAGIEVKGHIEQ